MFILKISAPSFRWFIWSRKIKTAKEEKYLLILQIWLRIIEFAEKKENIANLEHPETWGRGGAWLWLNKMQIMS